MSESSQRHRLPQHSSQPSVLKDEVAADTRRELCVRCNKFVHFASLTRHVREKHGGDKPYLCPVPGCGRGFYRREEVVEV